MLHICVWKNQWNEKYPRCRNGFLLLSRLVVLLPPISKFFFTFFFFSIHKSRNSEGDHHRFWWSGRWKWCLETSREIAHAVPRFRYEHDECRDHEHVILSRSSLISSRLSLTDLGEHEQLPMMFSAHNNSSPCIFPFTFFFYEHLRTFSIIFFVFHCFFYMNENKNKKLEIEKESRSIGNVTPS